MLKVCAVARRCEMRAVGTPAAAVRSPTVPQERRRRGPWTPRERRCWRRRLHGDLTESMEVPPRLYRFVAACLRRLHCVCIECYRCCVHRGLQGDDTAIPLRCEQSQQNCIKAALDHCHPHCVFSFTMAVERQQAGLFLLLEIVRMAWYDGFL